MFALLVLDLDDFKHVNDTLGHDAGDELLIKISERLEKTVRQSDYVARLGGDEFAVILPEIEDPNDASKVASTLIDALIKPCEVKKHTLDVTTSVGIACYPYAAENVTELYKCADIALYRAKNSGKNAFRYFTEALNKEYTDRIKIENALQKAIENEELYLMYQPRINMKDNQLIGMEVLSRWVHPELGNVPPAKFIPIAEEMGLLPEMGYHILQKACDQFVEWNKKYPSVNFYLAVNVSPHQIANEKLVKKMIDLLEGYNMDHSKLELELTESSFSGENEKIEESLHQLNKLGVHIAIDDFGTGYSCLSRLKNLPIHILKIDRSFINDVADDQNDSAIVKSIIALADALKLEVIAEGIEEKKQIDFLIQAGCYQAQGYFYSKPLVKEAMDKIIQQTM